MQRDVLLTFGSHLALEITMANVMYSTATCGIYQEKRRSNMNQIRKKDLWSFLLNGRYAVVWGKFLRPMFSLLKLDTS